MSGDAVVYAEAGDESVAVNAASEAALVAELRRQDYRKSQAGTRERVLSRSAFRDLSQGEAAVVGRQHAPDLFALEWNGPRLRPGEEKAEFLDDFRVRIRSAGKVGLIESSLPMRAADRTGRTRSVDTRLIRNHDVYRPDNPLVDVILPTSLSDGVRIPALGLTVSMASSNAARDPEVGAAHAFWGNVDADTDFVASLLPTGVEFTHQLRSPASPESFRLHLDLAEDVTVVSWPGDVDGFDIKRAGEVVGRILAPTAWDAQGEAVPVHAELDGGDLVLSVEHRLGDYAYPIEVDPVVDGFAWRMGYRASGGEPAGVYDRWVYSTNSDMWWWPAHNPTSAPNGYSNLGWGAGLGIYTYNQDGSAYGAGQYARWMYPAYGNATIFRAEFGYTYHKQSYTSVIRGIKQPGPTGDYDRGVCKDGNGVDCHNAVNGNGATPTNRADSFTAQWERPGSARAPVPGLVRRRYLVE